MECLNGSTTVWSNLWWNLIHLIVACLDISTVTVKTNNPYHNNSSLYLFPIPFFPCLSLVFRSFLSFYNFLFIFSFLLSLFPQLLKCRKTHFFFVRRSSSFNKQQDITTKSIVRVWSIQFSIYSYHLVRFTKIYHFYLSLSLSLSLSLYIYIYIYYPTSILTECLES